MKKVVGLFLATVLAGSANAALITETHDITASGAGSVGYTYFDVTTAGNFDIYTMGPSIDSVLYLFQNDGSLDSGDLISLNDDSCSTSQCGPSGSFSNALIDEIFLNIGSYIAAISDFGFSTSAAVNGLNNNDRTGLAAIVVDAGSTDTYGAAAKLSNASPVSEPGSLALLGLGALGLATVRRKLTK